jgi:hypothetical protein
MSETEGSTKASGCLYCLWLPLFVTFVGGLSVEYVKPEKSFAPEPPKFASPINSTTKPTVESTPSNGADIRRLLVRKWRRPWLDAGGYGEASVEFTEFGQALRTRMSDGNSAVTNLSFLVDDTGKLSSSKEGELALVKVSEYELVLSWNGSVAYYRGSWYWYEYVLIAFAALAVACLGMGILEAISGRSNTVQETQKTDVQANTPTNEKPFFPSGKPRLSLDKQLLYRRLARRLPIDPASKSHKKRSSDEPTIAPKRR